MRKVIVRKIDNLVVNAIEIKEKANWKPPKGCKLLSAAQSKAVNIGDIWDALK